MAPGIMDPRKVQLRVFQKEALASLASAPGHVICVAPTGSGKSLIYERFLAIGGARRMLLVTPLVALARQQAAKLRESGIRTWLGAGGEESPRASDRSGAWIVSPEKLLVDRNRRLAREWAPDLLVVDECHCLWEWGEGFRPAFRLVPGLVSELGVARSLWLTATLPLPARAELVASLPEPVRELGGFELPECLSLRIVRAPWPHRAEMLRAWVASGAGGPSGIVFAGTRDGTERVARLIRDAGERAVVYHAGMSREERSAVESRLRAGERGIVVATSAFGMGMDYPHLSWAALWQAPPSALALAQALGRVGRSGAVGTALLFWDPEDFRLIEWTTRGSPRRRDELMRLLGLLQESGCRRAALRRYFEREAPGGSCGGLCDVCAKDLRAPAASRASRSP